jgi:hypothetical protein
MDISHRSRAALENGADALSDAAQQMRRRARHGATRIADGASDIADQTWRGISYAGREVGSFVRRRPVETALLGAAAGCLIAGLVFWFTRRED